jgi:hypothetical protein
VEQTNTNEKKDSIKPRLPKKKEQKEKKGQKEQKKK